MDTVYEFGTGKDGWNRVKIGVEDGEIHVRDEVGHLSFQDQDIDELIRGLDEARRRLREDERRPTQAREEEPEAEQEA